MRYYDVIVIGAGIHGAAVARAAAADGYQVRILEQFDEIARGTSSRSSKLIHGGLRYLESRQFKLVRECLKERGILLKTAPQLVKLVPFYLPVYRHNRRPSWLIQLGLMLYRLLGGGSFRKLNTSEWASLDGLNTDDLVAVYQYNDAQTDDAALTAAVLQSAIEYGAELSTGCNVQHIRLNDDGCSIAINNETEQIQSKLVINATGPWVNQLLLRTQPSPPMMPIELVQGAHIILPHTLNKGVYYVEADDHRVIFAIPWKNQTLVGTTETPFDADPADVRPLEAEIDYLLSTWNNCFNDKLQRKDVVSAFAGLRVLPQDQVSAFSRSRDAIIHTDRTRHPHLISIYGGKLTSHRATADEVMRIVHKQLPGRIHSDTRNLPLAVDT